MIGFVAGLILLIIGFMVYSFLAGFSWGAFAFFIVGLVSVVLVFILNRIQEKKRFNSIIDDVISGSLLTEEGKKIKSVIDELLAKEKGKISEKLKVILEKLKAFEEDYMNIIKENDMQLNKINVIVTASEELSASAAEVASRIVQIANMVEQTAQISQDGLQKMDNIVKVINEVESTINAVRDLAKNLENETKEISDIVSTIEDIPPSDKFTRSKCRY
jgi:hypothetical protein